jgi:hypothetical protein
MAFRKLLAFVLGEIENMPGTDVADPSSLGTGATATNFLRGDGTYSNPLISNVTIKTINGSDITGPGNLVIAGGGGITPSRVFGISQMRL